MSNQEIARYHVYTSSAVASTGSAYTFYLHKPIILKHPSHYFKLLIKQCVIPYSFQAVNSNYNKLIYTLVRGSSVYPNRTVTIPNGNYSVYDLINAVINALTVDMQSVASFTPQLVFTYSPDTTLITFAITNYDAVLTSVAFQGDSNQIGSMMGVISSISFGYSATNVPFTATGQQPVNCSPITQLYIRSNTLKQRQNVENLVAGQYNDYSNIVGVVPVYSQPKSWINFYDLNIENDLNNQEINEIQLFLTDNRNASTNLSLNGLNWNCCLTFIEVRNNDLLENDAYLSSVNIHHRLRSDGGTVKEEENVEKGEKVKVRYPEETAFNLPTKPLPTLSGEDYKIV